MIAAISPADINFDETLSTLRYADSAKRIKNHAVVNEDPNARMIRELKEELAQLRSKLSGGASGGIMEEQYAPDTPLDKQIVSITQPDGTIKKVSKAEIVEQLSQSEKLYTDLNQTWEQKLQKTEEIHKEREAALEELGISIEKGFVGLSTPKKMPHLVNLSDDPLLAECLVYNLKPGTTTVGNVESATTAEIRLNGSQILHEHCVFENVDGAVTVVPRDNAGVMVNGQRIEKPKRLRSGYRIILGDFHIFRFNNPQEARAERAEQGSLLRHSVTVSQLGSPSPRPGHERSWSSISRPESEFDSESPGAASPIPFQPRNGRDSDWSYARREAVTAVLGTDQKINALTDEELDAVFDDLQRIRAVRRGRPESRMFETERDDDLESVSTYPVREKYASIGTIDNFSLDTMLTMPSTPQPGEEDERLRLVREDMQEKIDTQKEEYQAKLKSAEEANVEIGEIKAEKVKMEESLRTVKEEMQKQLQEQKEEFQRQLQELQQPMSPQSIGPPEPTERQIQLAKAAFEQWRQRRYVAMAETILQNAATLKEAQVMSQQMDKHVVFQFCIVDVGHSFASSYDLVLNGIPAEDDEDLDLAPKPCVGVRVVDFKNEVVHIWSLEKLRIRVRLMHQMHQYLNRPEYLQHFSLENPFLEPCMPEFSRVGDVDVPLAAVFESRVQDFSLDVISPYTANVVGIVRLSLEPSSAEAPSSMLKFNVVMHDMVGFPEREGTDVHAQLFVPGVSDEGGATTTSMIKDFDEGAIRFESVHSMSLPFASPRTSCLRASIFAKVTPMHLDKLLSWDDMRDSAVKPKKKRLASRLPESEFFTEEVHDIFSRIQIHEISEDGTYQPVEVIQGSPTDEGAYQLHQGLQRRIVVNLTHTSGETLQLHEIAGLRAGRVRLVDSSGTAPALDSPVHAVPVQLVHPPTVKANADGTTNVTFIGQWDSSAHASLLLDRATPDKYRVQVSLLWDVFSTRLASPMTFSLDLDMQIRSRSFMRQTTLFGFANLWNTTRVIHSTTGIFSVAIRPNSVKRATDLWRMNTRDDFIKGEEMLAGWTPRGVSLVKDYIMTQKRRRRIAEIETARSVLSSRALTAPTTNGSTNGTLTAIENLDERRKALLTRVLALWQTKKEPAEIILNTTNLEPPTCGAAFASRPLHPSNPPSSHNINSPGLSPAPVSPPAKPTLVATVRRIPKNPSLMKGGYLLMPDATASRWVRRYVELRKPYLHIYSVPEGDEINAVNMGNSRVDHQPQIARLLGGERGKESVWAVFARGNSYLMRARGEREKIEWILRIDESYFSSGSESPEE
jgi:kinesin family protein 1